MRPRPPDSGPAFPRARECRATPPGVNVGCGERDSSVDQLTPDPSLESVCWSWSHDITLISLSLLQRLHGLPQPDYAALLAQNLHRLEQRRRDAATCDRDAHEAKEVARLHRKLVAQLTEGLLHGRVLPLRD